MAKKSRKHLPSLTDDRLKLLEQQIDASKGLSKAGKRAVKASLQAAQNPDAESPDVIIASLPRERRETVVKHTGEFIQFSQGITARGKVGLEAMDEAEFQRLIDEANEDERS